MSAVDDIGYHSKRAMIELERASRSDNPAAARAHHGLAMLHLERMRALAAPLAGESAPRDAA